ncbi:MAG: DUF2007 domain-containing protein [Acidimicrobiia bacterium]
MDRTAEPFVHLADVGDLVSARVCAALLGSEGIEARLHGESLGPYPVTVGRMAVTQIWVPESAVERGKEVMLRAEIEHALGPEVRTGALANPEAIPMRLLALILVVVLAAAVIRLLVRVF